MFSRQNIKWKYCIFSSKILGLHLYFRFDKKNREGKDPHREKKGGICEGKDQHRQGRGELVKNGKQWWYTYFIVNLLKKIFKKINFQKMFHLHSLATIVKKIFRNVCNCKYK